jgi:hypothetical protein
VFFDLIRVAEKYRILMWTFGGTDFVHGLRNKKVLAFWKKSCTIESELAIAFFSTSYLHPINTFP